MNSTESLRQREIRNLKEILLFNFYLTNYTSIDSHNIDAEYIRTFSCTDEMINNYLDSFKCFKVKSPYKEKFEISAYDTWRKRTIDNLPNALFAQNQYVTSVINSEALKLKEKQIEGHCEYCGVSIDSIKAHLDSIKTKRLLTRGRSLEVDKKNPNGHYVIDNIALACYWCNNAKSDEYTVKEFEAIAIAIGKVWKERGIEVEPSKTIYYRTNTFPHSF